MTRLIHPIRNTSGNLYHYCPSLTEQITPVTCRGCQFLEQLEELPTKYRVHCSFGEDIALLDVEPAAASDTIKGLHGEDVLQSQRHTWMEPKLDGVRAIVHVTPQGVYITSRRQDKYGLYNQFQDNIPHIRDHEIFQRIGEQGYAIFDGEVLMPDNDRGTLASTMSVVGASPEKAITTQQEKGLAQLYLFDCLYFAGEDRRTLPLMKRRLYLPIGGVSIHPIPILPKDQQVFCSLLEQGYEGVIIKDPFAPYGATKAWLKVKKETSIDGIITGYSLGKAGGKHEATLGTLNISVIDADTRNLRHICEVSPGTDAKRKELYQLLKDKTSEEIISLALVVELTGQELTKDGSLRHPRIKRWREDKSAPNTM